MQDAYQIQVTLEGRMVWDSGRVESDQSVLVAYAGPALQAKQVYTYRVMVWDNHIRHGAWRLRDQVRRGKGRGRVLCTRLD